MAVREEKIREIKAIEFSCTHNSGFFFKCIANISGMLRRQKIAAFNNTKPKYLINNKYTSI